MRPSTSPTTHAPFLQYEAGMQSHGLRCAYSLSVLHAPHSPGPPQSTLPPSTPPYPTFALPVSPCGFLCLTSQACSLDMRPLPCPFPSPGVPVLARFRNSGRRQLVPPYRGCGLFAVPRLPWCLRLSFPAPKRSGEHELHGVASLPVSQGCGQQALRAVSYSLQSRPSNLAVHHPVALEHRTEITIPHTPIQLKK